MIQRVGQKITTDPNARVNPVVEEQIRVLETGGELKSVFTDDQIGLINTLGRRKSLARLRIIQHSIANEHHFGGE